jgi:hypothetical protein
MKAMTTSVPSYSPPRGRLFRVSLAKALCWSPFLVALSGYCLHPINDLFRMISGTPNWLVTLGGNTTKFIFLPVVALCTLGVLRHRNLRVGRLPAAWFALVAIITSLALAQGSWAVLTGQNALRYYVSHFGMAYMMLVTTLHYTLAAEVGSHWFPLVRCRTLARFSLGYFAVIYVIGFAFVRSGYWGINSALLIFPIAWYLLQRRWLATGLTAVLIVASGKRGTAVGMVAVLLTWFLMNYLASAGLKRLWRLAIGLVAVALGVGSLVFLARSDPSDLHPQLARAVAKWNELAPRDGEFSLEQASGGRFSEIQGALRTMSDSTPRQLWGSGFGWYFIWKEDPPPRPHHFTHISPVNFIVTYGWVGGTLFLTGTGTILTLCLWRVARRCRRADEPVPAFLFLVAAGLLGVSCTSFTLGVDPMFWIVLGMLFRCLLCPLSPAAHPIKPAG